jgi:WD40 repeat protein
LGGDDGRVVLWDTKTHRQMGEPLKGYGDRVNSIAFSPPDGRILASGGGDGLVILWNMDIELWKDLACRTANRNLTRSERTHYLEHEPYHKPCPNIPEGR